MAIGEFGLIDRFFSGMDAGAAVRLGVGDDAAVLSVPEGTFCILLSTLPLKASIFCPACPPQISPSEV